MNRDITLDGVKLTPMAIRDIVPVISDWLGKSQSPRQLTFINAYVYCLARKNRELNSIISSSDIVVPDGVSIVIASHLLAQKRITRVIMTHVFDAFLTSEDIPPCRGILIGTSDSEVVKAMQSMNSMSSRLKIVEAISGFHSEAYYAEVFSRHKDVDLIFVGMSTPKSELLCRHAGKICTRSIIWHIGGGTIMCYAGTKRRPPQWVITLGVEWMHRFIFEKHTRKRYLVYSAVFLYYLVAGLVKSIGRRQS